MASKLKTEPVPDINSDGSYPVDIRFPAILNIKLVSGLNSNHSQSHSGFKAYKLCFKNTINLLLSSYEYKIYEMYILLLKQCNLIL